MTTGDCNLKYWLLNEALPGLIMIFLLMIAAGGISMFLFGRS
jgi:hypothetical protein